MFEDKEKDFQIFNEYIRPSEDAIYKLKKFISILNEYQKKMNLIGRSTLPYIWTRHILDSAQIEKFLPKEDKKYITVDVGTGAGFPGIVLAALGRQDILLCEKSKKKNLFLNTVIKECKFEVNIYNDRIENLRVGNIRTIVSRAFSPLKTFLLNLKNCICHDSILVLHKGKTYMEEIIEAKKIFRFNYKCYSSFTNFDAKILKINNVREKK